MARNRRRDTPPPSTAGGERDVLLSFLDYLRESISGKVVGVPEPEVRTAGVTSGTNLLGLLNHLTYVERFIFLGENVDDWSTTFHADTDISVDDVVAAYRDVIRRANEVIVACNDLTEPTRRPTTRKNAPSMRWALIHMIEETGRHAGHADILRELIDGNTGR